MQALSVIVTCTHKSMPSACKANALQNTHNLAVAIRKAMWKSKPKVIQMSKSHVETVYSQRQMSRNSI